MKGKIFYTLALCSLAFSLSSCNPDTTPKDLSFDETLEYIKKNAKELIDVKVRIC